MTALRAQLRASTRASDDEIELYGVIAEARVALKYDAMNVTQFSPRKAREEALRIARALIEELEK